MPIESFVLGIHLIMIFLAGAFGGILEFLNRFDLIRDSKSTESNHNSHHVGYRAHPLYDKVELSFRELVWIGFTHTLHGVGGAFAVTLSLFSLNQFKLELTDENQLFLISLYVIGGYGGSRFLDKVKYSIENQFQKSARQMEENLFSRIDTAREKASLEVIASDIISQAYNVLEMKLDKSRSDIQHIVDDLEDLMDKGVTLPRHFWRKAAIMLGRLYRHKFDDLNKGLLALNKFIDGSRKLNKLDEHFVAVLFNVACYKTELIKNSKAENASEGFQEVEKILEEAISISPAVRDQIYGSDDSSTTADKDLKAYRDWQKSQASGQSSS
ncbi:hypothetical protein [Thalassotalea euphylliae]|uniref:Uncharacterized protein n=1 Tax=Thalassotalea euphylliae TaxID=1655234 RepID=A0A3E0U3Y4_9GAMM|nr:hypothetical protein [Thalassotalea euphylliae]REL31297.1 hypothetical protein DXX94_11565 [Thalassotalea euphylliae]